MASGHRIAMKYFLLVPPILLSETSAAFRFGSPMAFRPSHPTRTFSSGGVAQDPSELFDVYRPPPAPDTILSTPPARTGETKERSLVHRDGDWHRAIHVWLVDDHRNILLQRRSEGKDTHPGMLDVSCAGHVAAGNDVDETAVRELEEELGLTGIAVQEARDARAFTIASSIEGSTERHGPFVCREFQEVYLLRRTAPLVAGSFVPEVAEEVAGFEVSTVERLLERLLAKDGEIVPRTSVYVEALTKALG